MLGKDKCRILKEIRRRIADENDIPYVTRECHFQGACKGTCPRCESELRYLEQQLAQRASLGKRVAVAALCAGVTLSAAGCSPLEQRENDVETDLTGAVAYVEPAPEEDPGECIAAGEILYPEEPCDPGLPSEEPESPVPTDLTGDVVYPDPADEQG